MQFLDPKKRFKQFDQQIGIFKSQLNLTGTERNIRIWICLVCSCFDVKPLRNELEWICPNIGIAGHEVRR